MLMLSKFYQVTSNNTAQIQLPLNYKRKNSGKYKSGIGRNKI